MCAQGVGAGAHVFTAQLWMSLHVCFSLLGSLTDFTPTLPIPLGIVSMW